MAKKEKTPSNHPVPNAPKDKVYLVRLTEREMQCIANACAGFINVMNRERVSISPLQTMGMTSALRKMKEADLAGVDIQVVGSLS